MLTLAAIVIALVFWPVTLIVLFVMYWQVTLPIAICVLILWVVGKVLGFMCGLLGKIKLS